MKCDLSYCKAEATEFYIGIYTGVKYVRCNECRHLRYAYGDPSPFRYFRSYDEMQLYLIKEKL